MKTPTTILAATFAAASLMAGTASADTSAEARQPSNPDTVSAIVRFSELDLMRADGARTLLRRINQAAKTICGPQPSELSLRMDQAYRQCVAQSVGRAVRDLKAPLVTALYELDVKPVLMAVR